MIGRPTFGDRFGSRPPIVETGGRPSEKRLVAADERRLTRIKNEAVICVHLRSSAAQNVLLHGFSESRCPGGPLGGTRAAGTARLRARLRGKRRVCSGEAADAIELRRNRKNRLGSVPLVVETGGRPSEKRLLATEQRRSTQIKNDSRACRRSRAPLATPKPAPPPNRKGVTYASDYPQR